MNRLLLSVVLAVGAFTSPTKVVRAQDTAAPWDVRPLPFAYDALEPVVSEDMLRRHHLVHYAGHVKAANELIANHPANRLLGRNKPEQIIKTQRGTDFDCVVQMWNYNFYFKSISPPAGGGGGEPEALSYVARQIKWDFGGFEGLRREMRAAARDLLGSGWAWLSWGTGEKRLVVTGTGGDRTPLRTRGLHPLLAINVWEHGEKREDYVDAFFDGLVNWEAVEAEFAAAPGVGDIWEAEEL